MSYFIGAEGKNPFHNGTAYGKGRFCGCADNQQPDVNGGNDGNGGNGENGTSGTETNGDVTSFGEELNNADAYDGYFSETVNEVTV